MPSQKQGAHLIDQTFLCQGSAGVGVTCLNEGIKHVLGAISGGSLDTGEALVHHIGKGGTDRCCCTAAACPVVPGRQAQGAQAHNPLGVMLISGKVGMYLVGLRLAERLGQDGTVNDVSCDMAHRGISLPWTSVREGIKRDTMSSMAASIVGRPAAV